MRPDILGQEYRALAEEFDRAFRKYRKGHKVKHLHRLRVSVKKMRSIWKVLAVTEKDLPDKALRKQLGTLFSAAGRLREAQVNLSLVSEHKLQFLAGYHDRLLLEERKRQEELDAVMEGIGRKSLRRRQHKIERALSGIAADIASLVSGCIQEAYQHAFDELRADNGPDLHRVRKEIRILDTQLELLNKTEPSQGIEKLHQSLHPLLDQLGEWHDDLVLMKALDDYIANDSREDLAFLKVFRQGLDDRIERKAQEIRGALGRLEFPKELLPQ